MDQWLPIGFLLPDGYTAKKTLQSGNAWQIINSSETGKSLIVRADLHGKWLKAGLVEEGTFSKFSFSDEEFYCLYSPKKELLTSLENSASPRSKKEALAFSYALDSSREKNLDVYFHDSIYVEHISRLLPTYTISSPISDDIVLGYWLTGGISISVYKTRKINQILSWLEPKDIQDIIRVAGFDESNTTFDDAMKVHDHSSAQESVTQFGSLSSDISTTEKDGGSFILPGREELTQFFNEHIIDIINDEDRYKRLGINFPAAIILYGPPGTGKTYAVEKLTNYLGWPMFAVDATSIGSSYIHETSKKIAEIFKKAIENSPSILVIDEMDAFLSDRESGPSGQHRVEEIAEFLRQIPEATKNKVLIVGMTNRIDMIDPAILRRGRFDHVINVEYASREEVLNMIKTSLNKIPKADDLNLETAAEELAGRPLSDAAFVLREAARLAARAGKDLVDQESLAAALSATPSRDNQSSKSRPIGFL
jgi:ATP-dependent 26S proteasome regulatory subunit